MNDDANRNRGEMSDYKTEPKIANGLDLICCPPSDAVTARLIALKEQLAGLFSRLERGELSSGDAKTQSVLIREELSRMIWSVEDWQIQSLSRN